MRKQQYVLVQMAVALLILSLLLLTSAANLNAESITLDFDSPETGSGILDLPLMSPLGNITAMDASGFSTFMGTGNALMYSDSAPKRLTSLSFDFDVAKITFIYTGETTGLFNAQVSNEAGEIVDAFFNPDTGGQPIWGPVTLSAPGIRKLEFGDAPRGDQLAAIDNVVIDTVPEPTALWICALGMVWISRMMRSRDSSSQHALRARFDRSPTRPQGSTTDASGFVANGSV